MDTKTFIPRCVIVHVCVLTFDSSSCLLFKT